MGIQIDFVYLVAAAFSVTGVMEYIKGFPFAKKLPTWAWQIALPVICIGVAVAADGGFFQIATNAVILLALSQLAYQSIVQAVKKAIEKVGQ